MGGRTINRWTRIRCGSVRFAPYKPPLDFLPKAPEVLLRRLAVSPTTYPGMSCGPAQESPNQSPSLGLRTPAPAQTTRYRPLPTEKGALLGAANKLFPPKNGPGTSRSTAFPGQCLGSGAARNGARNERSFRVHWSPLSDILLQWPKLNLGSLFERTISPVIESWCRIGITPERRFN
jgi:hypothetical protein